MDTDSKNSAQHKKNVWRMFDKISHRYDLLNRLLSFRQDVVWRNKLVSFIPQGRISVLDLATGTGDVLLTIAKKRKPVHRLVGLDMAQQMLQIGKQKFIHQHISNFFLIPGDAQLLPFQKNSFDVVTMAFGIRNVSNVSLCLNEIFRITKNNGRILILEFSLPLNGIVKWSYLFYFRYILPKIGGIVSGDYKAYSYLNKTVEVFPHGDAFSQLLISAGFNKAEEFPQTFGIATIYKADKLTNNPVS